MNCNLNSSFNNGQCQKVALGILESIDLDL